MDEVLYRVSAAVNDDPPVVVVPLNVYRNPTHLPCLLFMLLVDPFVDVRVIEELQKNLVDCNDLIPKSNKNCSF